MEDLPVIRTAEEAKKLDPKQPVLVEVPGEVAPGVLWLTRMLREPDDSETGQLVKRLLTQRRGGRT